MQHEDASPHPDAIPIVRDSTADAERGGDPLAANDAGVAAESPGTPTPDQTRFDGPRPGLAGTLSRPETSGDIE